MDPRIDEIIQRLARIEDALSAVGARTSFIEAQSHVILEILANRYRLFKTQIADALRMAVTGGRHG